MENTSSVTPWEVSEDINYEKLQKDFGTEKIPDFKEKKDLHPLIKRNFFFSHRDFNLWLKDAEAGKQVSILTGRGPSEKMHLGHLIPFLVAKSLQEKYGCEIYIPISEDEKFFVKPYLSLDNAKKFSEDNILDIIALGFNPKKTFIVRDFSYPPLYEFSARAAKLITYSEARAVFGLKPGTNIGWTFYPAVQAAHILLPQLLKGPHRTLVPVAIDQDPFIRLTRDIAQNKAFKLLKPSAIHSKFLPSLKGAAKMSASDSEETNVIYLSDSPAEVKKKINKYAFSGGRDTLEEHRRLGGNPDIDISFQYLKMLFEPDDKKLHTIYKDYKSGALTSGELKKYLIEEINTFLKEHQKNKNKAKSQLKNFILK